jgi:parallel beta-helix repeat protein
MNMQRFNLCAAFAAAALSAFGQGSLIPPGAPAETMKTLEQIEPRMPISALPYAIATSGSYYLTTNATAASGSGITIEVGNVTLDLGGFTLAGADGTGDGIFIDGNQTNIWIGSGTVAGWGGAGVNAAAATAAGFSALRVVGNGGWGIDAGERATVRSCTAVENGDGSNGGINADIHSLIQDCLATFNRGFGIHASGGGTVRDCVAINNNQGIEAGDASTVQGCTSRDNGAEGFFAGAGVSIAGCAATANGGYGFRCSEAAVIAGCTARSNLRGIVAGSGATVKDCSAFNSVEVGIEAGVNAAVSGCSALNNGGSGISVGVGSTVVDCAARSNTEGILAGTGSTVRDCTAHYNNLGISVPNHCYLLNNNSHGNSYGIVVGLDRNRIEGNNVTDNGQYGLNVVYPGNIVLRNTARGNGTNYNIVPTNTVGQILDYSAEAGGGIVTNANSWANFSF